jgi:hypothetical protein
MSLVTWEHDLEHAKQLAQEQNKLVMLDFFSPA